jgi:hypothetical protein
MAIARKRPPRKRKYKFRPYGLAGEFKTWDEFEKYNKTQPCSNPACDALRHNRGKWCANCSHFGTAFGDGRYRPVKLEQYKPQLKIVEDVIEFNRDNIIITDHCDKWETLANHGKLGLNIEFSTWFAGIHGVLNHRSNIHKRDPRNYLSHFVAVYLMYHETGNELIKNENLWHYALADIALRRCKGLVRPKATGKRMIKFGVFLWGAFSLTWLKIARAVMDNEVKKRIREKKLAEAVLLLPAQE